MPLDLSLSISRRHPQKASLQPCVITAAPRTPGRDNRILHWTVAAHYQACFSRPPLSERAKKKSKENECVKNGGRERKTYVNTSLVKQPHPRTCSAAKKQKAGSVRPLLVNQQQGNTKHPLRRLHLQGLRTVSPNLKLGQLNVYHLSKLLDKKL